MDDEKKTKKRRFPVNPLDYIQSVESNARTYAAIFRHMFVAGNGIFVRDADGCEYIDCLANAGALPLGHNHPEIKDVVLSHVLSDQLQQALDLTTPAKLGFIQELFETFPAALRNRAKIQFCGPSGSDAVEAAIKLTKYFTERDVILSFHGGYHGMTAGALGAMGNLSSKIGLGGLSHGVHFAPYPYMFRCPFGTDGGRTEELSLNYIRTLLSDPESGVPKPAAVLVEPVQGEGGSIPAPASWLKALRQLTIEHDVLLIMDEVQTGLGRTGSMFAFEQAGIIPDVLVLSKAIGGGYPLAVVVYDKRLDIWPPGKHAGTFRGNQIAMVAGQATIRVIKRDRLDHGARNKGKLFRDGLLQLAERFPFIGDVRGLGLMIGVEVINPNEARKTASPDGTLAKAIKLNCLDNGLIIETGGRSGAVLRFLPPLIASEADIGEILNRFEQACRKTSLEERPRETVSVAAASSMDFFKVNGKGGGLDADRM
jgi:diaminobutyrate-2-oxoglutarate transaminase